MQKIFDEPSAPLARGGPALYRSGVVALESLRYIEALADFERLLLEQPNSSYALITRFQSARALEGLERWSDAESRYREVVQGAARVAPKLHTLALYRITYCAEALGLYEQSLAALMDVYLRKDTLPKEVASAELPARIASAYARIGNFVEAQKYYVEAEGGIHELRRARKLGAAPDWFARTLFFMGKTNLKKPEWSDFSQAVRPLRRAQTFLLQASELGVEPWSEMAANELIKSYENLWAIIQNPPSSSEGSGELDDHVVFKREIQEQKIEYLDLIHESLRDLRYSQIPNETPSPALKNVIDFRVTFDDRLQKALVEQREGVGLTADAIRRKESIRGRVLVPDPILEKAFRVQKSPASIKNSKAASEPPAHANDERIKNLLRRERGEDTMHVPSSPKSSKPPSIQDPNL